MLTLRSAALSIMARRELQDAPVPCPPIPAPTPDQLEGMQDTFEHAVRMGYAINHPTKQKENEHVKR